MKSSTTLKKTVVIMTCAILGSVALPSAAQTTKWLVNNMPHAYEFGSENPNVHLGNSNGWCGHTALKITGQYVSGQTKTLSQIHEIFKKNSPGGYAIQETKTPNIYCDGNSSYHWCSGLFDLMMAAGSSNNGGYGRPGVDPWNVTTVASSVDFFTKVKNAINANQPVIVPSDWKYANIGHFWVIVGYTDWGSPSGSALYLRDVAIPTPKEANADWSVDVTTFYNNSPKHQILIMK